MNSQTKPFVVLCEHGILTKTLGKAIKQHFMRLPARGRQTVVAPEPFFSRHNQPHPAKIRQVPRSGGLRHAQHSHQVANAQLPTAEQIQNPQPRLVGERAKDRLGWGGCGSCFHIRLCKYSDPKKSRQDWIAPDLPKRIAAASATTYAVTQQRGQRVDRQPVRLFMLKDFHNRRGGQRSTKPAPPG